MSEASHARERATGPNIGINDTGDFDKGYCPYGHVLGDNDHCGRDGRPEQDQAGARGTNTPSHRKTNLTFVNASGPEAL
jgi:hypothetical protein